MYLKNQLSYMSIATMENKAQYLDGTKTVYEYDLSNRLVREKEINSSGTVT
jgi:hypothetical protein